MHNGDVMRYDTTNPNKQLDATRAQLVARTIEYLPRFESTVKDGVRTFTIDAIKYLYRDKRSKNVIMVCTVQDHDDTEAIPVKGYIRKDGVKVNPHTRQVAKVKPRKLNVELWKYKK